MTRPRCQISRLHDDDGQTLVEYALILSAISLGLIVAMGFLRGGIAQLFSDVMTSLPG
jgi:Flp pilus assembly pilin Flp